MNRISFLVAMRGAVVIGVALFLLPGAKAQSSLDLDAALRGLTDADVETRIGSFDALIIPAENNTGSTPMGVRNLLRAYPGQADKIKQALFTALELAAGHVQGLKERGGHFDEGFSDYYGDLIWAVTSLRDPRALKGLLGAINTGRGAMDGLADLGAIIVDPLIERSLGDDAEVRCSAVDVLGEFLKRHDMVRINPDSAGKAREAIMASLVDPDP